jgi:hypothetical protein
MCCCWGSAKMSLQILQLPFQDSSNWQKMVWQYAHVLSMAQILYFQLSPIHHFTISESRTHCQWYDPCIFALSQCWSCILSSWGSSRHYAGIRFTIANGHTQISNLPSLIHILLVHYLTNASTQCPWVQMLTPCKHGAPNHFCDLVFHDCVAGHIPLNWSQFQLLMCLYVEISVWIAMCGTWVWTWLFWILVNFWCATDVLLHPLWTFHKLHFINESSDLSPTAWSMCLEDLIESPVVCVTDQTHTYRHTIFCQSL